MPALEQAEDRCMVICDANDGSGLYRCRGRATYAITLNGVERKVCSKHYRMLAFRLRLRGSPRRLTKQVIQVERAA